MSQFDEKMDIYLAEAKSIGVKVDSALLGSVAKSLGPSIYLGDASLVSSSDAEEMARVKNNFLIGKLGLADGQDLDDAMEEVVNKFGSSNRNKHRALFYTLLVEKFNKQSMF